MSSDDTLKARMAFAANCGVCGVPLIYTTDPVSLRCSFCGAESSTLIYCPEGHYICDACHEREALDVLRKVLESSTSTSPADILERVMSHPAVPMHGPEHHAVVPAAIVAAARNAGYPIPAGAVEEAVARGAKVPGGWCGFYGACGAGIGVGIAVSVLTQATPLRGAPRRLANAATAFALSEMLHEHPRCCKRASRKALRAALKFLRAEMGIELESGPRPACSYTARNRECPRGACDYYPGYQVVVPRPSD
ncbi:MAG: DUF5714 domain-containing protein [Bacteroidetes bacterium]|nr:DUF5714 domain-containing protein [Bacteroidota bacterium]MCL5025002.1 DUF5714 domain-containing protein [Chloroflexota bacterium]